eukprot:TRINITY_DN40544_c0_g1_i1.p1 TRINITY_DN40544_c0_g1~~TRINITY_DN40544_c0_g1_i1.p1  ORF type:complete len:1122 (+),score=187.06 TRINITY_DN40544_c0_g1_i1:87-3452(+)
MKGLSICTISVGVSTVLAGSDPDHIQAWDGFAHAVFQPKQLVHEFLQGSADSAAAMSRNTAVLTLVMCLCVILLLLAVMPRRCRFPAPMPWNIWRTVSYGQLRVVAPEPHLLDSTTLEVHLLSPQDFVDVKSSDDQAELPLKALLEWVVQNPHTGYKGGLARLVGKLKWLERGNPVLESEIAGFNDIDIIKFLKDGEEDKMQEMKAAVDAGLTIGGIAVEACDVEYSYDTIAHMIATRDLTQNQCLIVSDRIGQVFLINSKVCREHFLAGVTAPACYPEHLQLDDSGNIIMKPRVLGRAFLQWMKDRAQRVELNEATMRYYQEHKLPQLTQYQIFSKAKGNDMYMKMYAELVRLGFLEKQQFPHILWGECYAFVNAMIAREGYRLELESEFDSKAVELWKESKYAEQSSNSRVSIYRDFRWHQLVIDQSYLVPYAFEESAMTSHLAELETGQAAHSNHRTHDNRRYLRRTETHADFVSLRVDDGRIVTPGGHNLQRTPGLSIDANRVQDFRDKLRIMVKDQQERYVREMGEQIRNHGSVFLEHEEDADAQREPLLNQTLFGKLTIVETVMHVILLVKPAKWGLAGSFCLNCLAAFLYTLVIKHVVSLVWLLPAAALSVIGCVVFLTSANRAILHTLTSLYMAMLNMKLSAFSSRMFPEIWARLTGDTRALTSVLQALNDLCLEVLTLIASLIAVFTTAASAGSSCDSAPIWNMLFVILSSMIAMAVVSFAAGVALRAKSRTVRSTMGFLYHNVFTSLIRFFEIKTLPEEWTAASVMFYEAQTLALEERKKLGILEQVMGLFLRYIEIACTTLVIFAFADTSNTACRKSYSVQAVAVSLAAASVRRSCTLCLRLMSSVGSLERIFLLGRAMLRLAVPRFDGITRLGAGAPIEKLEIPEAFTLCVGSNSQFGPFAYVPALPAAKRGCLNLLSMPRGSGSTSLAKVLLKLSQAPARVKVNGLHIEQYEQEAVSWAVHVIDHAPFPSSVATVPGQNKSLVEYVQLGLPGEGIGATNLMDCLQTVGLQQTVMNLPHGIENTSWATILKRPDAYRVQLAQALFRISLGTVQLLVVIDPLRDAAAEERDALRSTWIKALLPLKDKVMILIIDQSSPSTEAWHALLQGC